jgi:hypothetical protein
VAKPRPYHTTHELLVMPIVYGRGAPRGYPGAGWGWRGDAGAGPEHELTLSSYCVTLHSVRLPGLRQTFFLPYAIIIQAGQATMSLYIQLFGG